MDKKPIEKVYIGFSNELYSLPAMIIAESKARYYATKDALAGENYDEVYQKQLTYTLSDFTELTDWAYNNMDWEEIDDNMEFISERKKPSKKSEWEDGTAVIYQKAEWN